MLLGTLAANLLTNTLASKAKIPVERILIASEEKTRTSQDF